MTNKRGEPNGTPEAGSGKSPTDDGLSKTPMQTDKLNAPNGAQSEATLGADVQDHLGRKLKASYAELVRQPVPDKFRELLEELERREKHE